MQNRVNDFDRSLSGALVEQAVIKGLQYGRADILGQLGTQLGLLIFVDHPPVLLISGYTYPICLLSQSLRTWSNAVRLPSRVRPWSTWPVISLAIPDIPGVFWSCEIAVFLPA